MYTSDESSPATTPSTTSTRTRLTGQQLPIARGIWFALTAVSIVGYSIARLAVLKNPDVLSQTAYAPLLDEPLWQFWLPDLIITTGYVLSGLLLMWRGSRDWLATLASYSLIGLGTSVISDTGGILLAISQSYLPLIIFADALPIMGILALFYLFPDGSFVPRWTRWLLVPAVPMSFVVIITYYVVSDLSTSVGSGTLGLLASLLLIGLGCQVYRYRRVSGVTQRQQTKWVVLGFLAFTTDILFSILIYEVRIFGDPFTLYTPPIAMAFALVELALPASLVVSILRFRLWDIDYLINRSLVYGVLIVLLVVLFGGSLFVVSWVFQDFEGGPIVAVAVTAAIFGVLFNPLSRQLRAFVDHRLYGIGIEYATIASNPRRMMSVGITQIGNYDNLEPVGSGGMAEVYRAVHPTLGHAVAVKILPQRLAERDEFRRRFEREAQVVASLKHPNIVQMYDFGVDAGIYYMVMEFIEGVNLSQLIRSQQRLPLEHVRDVVRDVASALDYAHEQGLVHRDIKPSNVMIEGERAVLMDFGIARIASAMTQLTGTGGMVGTPDYISPEQIRDAKDVDGRADVYSLGVMAYHMLTGELPFRKSSAAALVLAHLMEPPPDPRQLVPALPSSIAHGIMRAMSKEPLARFERPGELAQVLTTG